MSDTSVFIDLERGGLIEVSFKLPYQFAVPDVMYDRELKSCGGPELIRQGLEVVESSDTISMLATQYARTIKSLSVPDAFAIALAKSHGWKLLVGDGELRNLAATEQVDCHGVLWVFDQLYTTKLAPLYVLHEALTVVSEHPTVPASKARNPPTIEQVSTSQRVGIIKYSVYVSGHERELERWFPTQEAGDLVIDEAACSCTDEHIVLGLSQ